MRLTCTCAAYNGGKLHPIIYNKSNKNGKFRTILGAILFPYWT